MPSQRAQDVQIHIHQHMAHRKGDKQLTGGECKDTTQSILSTQKLSLQKELFGEQPTEQDIADQDLLRLLPRITTGWVRSAEILSPKAYSWQLMRTKTNTSVQSGHWVQMYTQCGV